MVYHVYILRCSDGRYYVGTTQDLEGREAAHNEGRGAQYTSIRRPVRLVYFESFTNLDSAIQRERQIKRWTRAKKDALVTGDLDRLRRLSKSRTRSP